MTIAEYIQKDLEARVARDEELPYRLTLASMSSFYEVSPMPVRTAVQGLIDDGVLLKLPNGRLDLSPDAQLYGAAAGPAPPPKSLEEHEREIADFAVRASLRGESQYLREEGTARRFGIGRSMVRRIFSRLSGAGVLEHVPRCGWRIEPYREADMLAYIDIREALELKALELARPRLVRADLERMLAANSPTDEGEPRIDNSLHHYWIGLADNRYIQEWFRVHGPYYETVFDFATFAESSVAEMSAQHRQVLELLLADDFEGAREALMRHIRAQEPKVSRLIANYRREADTADLANGAVDDGASVAGSASLGPQADQQVRPYAEFRRDVARNH